MSVVLTKSKILDLQKAKKYIDFEIERLKETVMAETTAHPIEPEVTQPTTVVP